jgi:hypothetical protein
MRRLGSLRILASLVPPERSCRSVDGPTKPECSAAAAEGGSFTARLSALTGENTPASRADWLATAEGEEGEDAGRDAEGGLPADDMTS